MVLSIGVAAGAGLVGAVAASMWPEPVAHVDHRVEVYEREVIVGWAEMLEVETPIVDALVDWDKVDRETDCLWEFLQAQNVDITMRAVLAAGEWLEVNGGACVAVGRE